MSDEEAVAAVLERMGRYADVEAVRRHVASLEAEVLRQEAHATEGWNLANHRTSQWRAAEAKVLWLRGVPTGLDIEKVIIGRAAEWMQTVEYPPVALMALIRREAALQVETPAAASAPTSAPPCICPPSWVAEQGEHGNLCPARFYPTAAQTDAAVASIASQASARTSGHARTSCLITDCKSDPAPGFTACQGHLDDLREMWSAPSAPTSGQRAAARLAPCPECGAPWVVFAGGDDAGMVHFPGCSRAPAPASPPPTETRLCMDCRRTTTPWTGKPGEHPSGEEIIARTHPCCHDADAGWYYCASTRSLLARETVFRKEA